MAYCKKCGTKLPPDAKLCPECGTDTGENPGCFMMAVGPLLIVMGLTTLFGIFGLIAGLAIAAVIFFIGAVTK